MATFRATWFTHTAVEQSGHPGAVGRVGPYPLAVEVTLQHRELVSESEDLCVLVAVAAW